MTQDGPARQAANGADQQHGAQNHKQAATDERPIGNLQYGHTDDPGGDLRQGESQDSADEAEQEMFKRQHFNDEPSPGTENLSVHGFPDPGQACGQHRVDDQQNSRRNAKSGKEAQNGGQLVHHLGKGRQDGADIDHTDIGKGGDHPMLQVGDLLRWAAYGRKQGLGCIS